MKYEIIGGSFPAANVTLDAGETVVTQSGAMAWSDADIEMNTNAEGGFLKSLGRMFSGASLMFVRHTAVRDDSHITFSASFPGTIREFEIDDEHEYYAQKSAFLVADESVIIDASVNKNFWAGLLGGEGFILQKFTGEGTLLTEIDGSVVEYELAPGQKMVVDTGYLAMMDATCTMDVQAVSGVKNVLFGGESLFNTVITGPGKILLQTMPMSNFASAVGKVLPRK